MAARSRKLKDLVRRAETWPDAALEDAIATLEAIEAELAEPYELTERDRQAIDRGLADLRHGRIATEEEIDRLFARYRHP